MKKFFALITLCFLFGCQNSAEKKSDVTPKKSSAKMPELEGTKWQFKLADDCISYYLFKSDSNSISYACDSENKYYGKYYVNADTLYIDEYVYYSESDCESDCYSRPADESDKRSVKGMYKYKLILEDNKLKCVELWYYYVKKDLWEKKNLVFSNLFEKVE